MALNKVAMIGRLADNVKIKETKTNSKLGICNLCIVEKYKNAKNIYEERLDYFSLIFWGGAADLIKRLAVKGDTLYIEGKLKHNTYVDKEGNSKQKTDILVQLFHVFPSSRRLKSGRPAGDVKPDRSGSKKFDW